MEKYCQLQFHRTNLNWCQNQQNESRKELLKALQNFINQSKMFYYNNNIPIQVQPFWYDTNYIPITYGYYPSESSRQMNTLFSKNYKQNQPTEVKVETSESLNVKMEPFQRQIANQPVCEQSSKKIPAATNSKKKQKKRYKRKNNETNIINQIFSFLCYQKKSQKVCSRLFDGNNKKVQTFYAYMKSLKKYRTKYLNVNYLKVLISLPEKSQEWRVIQRSKKRQQILSIDDLKKTIYKLAYYFLRNECQVYLILSKRLNDISIQSHLHKRRQILNVLTQQFTKLFQQDEQIKVQQQPFLYQSESSSEWHN